MNARPETIEFLEENIGSMLLDIGPSGIFLDMSPQARETKAKINKWDCIKLKRLCIAQETSNKTRRQPTKWEKVFVNHMSDKGLISTLYKELT